MTSTVLRTRKIVAFALLCLGAVVSSQHASSQTILEPAAGQPGKDVVWVPTPPELVEKMLDLAQVTPQDFVMDLGSGDGRNVIAAATRGARALGIEYDANLVELSRKRATDAGVAGKASFVQGDMYEADVSQASVLALFLKPENLDRMRDKFLAMKPGTRIVLNTFQVTDWEPDATTVLGPSCKVWCTAMLVIVPARVAGIWHTGGTEMALRQDFQVVRGAIGTHQLIGHLRGDRITLKAGDSEYTGRVVADRIEGTVTTAGKQTEWIASRRIQ
jgi:precorrin-6B methylase 2